MSKERINDYLDMERSLHRRENIPQEIKDECHYILVEREPTAEYPSRRFHITKKPEDEVRRYTDNPWRLASELPDTMKMLVIYLPDKGSFGIVHGGRWTKLSDRKKEEFPETTDIEEANMISLSGEDEVSSNNEPVTETYTAQLDVETYGVPVVFQTSFSETDIDDIGEGSVEDFCSEEGVTVTTDSNGIASLSVTFSDGLDKEEDIVASIDDSHYLVDSSDADNISVRVTTVSQATEVSIAGDDEVKSDGILMNGTYTATVNLAQAGIPVTLSTDFSETDILSVGEHSIEDFCGDGITIDTDGSGEVEIDVTFAEQVDSTEYITVSIDGSDDYVYESDDADIEVTVQTLGAYEVTLAGEESPSSDGESVTETYTATINVNIEGVPVYFTVDRFDPDDIDEVDGDSENVSALFGETEDDAYVVSTDSNGEAKVDITFAEDKDVVGDLFAAIEAEDDGVRSSDYDSLEITVDTQPEP